jgi:flagellar basal-body rod protein FlgG
MSYAVQGALRQENRLQIQANHMANSATTGFKSQVLSFDEMLQARMTLDTRQGDLVATESPLDLAISGDGFFKIQTDQGIRYTRNGNFSLNADGTLVTGVGDVVLGENGPITIDGDVITIGDTGEIDVDETVVGTLKIVSFEAPEQLTKGGNSLLIYGGPETDEIVPANIEVRQGHLEQSNVEVVREMTNMVTTNRSYESFQKLMQTIDELNTKAVTEVGKIG